MSQAEAAEAIGAGGVSAAAAAPAGELRGRLLRGTIFELGGYGLQQVIRFGSNLILTRLLYPQAFGLASIVYTLITGLSLIAETGFAACVIQSKRGDDPKFLNTVFTAHALRGVTLAAAMVILAKPTAWFYREPQLDGLIQLGSLQLLFNGLHGTSIMTLRRHLKVGWINALDLGQQMINIGVMMAIAVRRPVPAALVLGSIASTACYAVATHLLPVGYRNRFGWDRAAARELGRFGRWVVGSNAAAFLGGQSDRILLGRFLGAAWLGVYGVALSLSEAINVLALRLTSGIVYPAFSHVTRDRSQDLADFYYRVRIRLDLMVMSGTGFLAGVGPWIVHALWDERYGAASWMVQILSARVALICVFMQPEWCLISHGFTRYSFQRSTVRLVANLLFIPVGWRLAGPAGVVWGTAAGEIAAGLTVVPKAYSMGFFRPGREALTAVIFAGAFLIGRAAAQLLPAVHLHLHLHRQ